jgi:hypothetical protein
MISAEEEQWASDKANGSLDDPIDPDWKPPQCSCCHKFASLAVMPRSYSIGTLDFPPYKDAVFYCMDHWPEKYRR